MRTHVNESSVRAEEIARTAISRYDEISRIGRKSLTVAPVDYDWHSMLAAGRNLYGNPDECIKIFYNARQNYYFDTLTTTFNFGGIAHKEIKKSMRLFAKEVMPVIKSE